MVSNKRTLERAFTPRKRRSNSFRPNPVLNKASTNSNIRVVVRVRPPNERDNGFRQVIKVMDDKMLIFDPKEEDQPFFFAGVKQRNRDMLIKKHKQLNFFFDKVYGNDASNQDVFEGSTKDLIKSLLEGYNCSVFVYGATGAGKTFTMLGNKHCPGISYLTMVELYAQIKNMEEEKEFELGISYMEVYNENVQDLIKPSGPLQLRDDGNNGTVVAGIQVRRITSAEELFSLLEQGNRNRTQHPTDANSESSRSHAVFQVFIRITNKFNREVKLAKLVMIDLAGSERGAATGCKGIRFTEGSSINKSLLALGNCVNALADGLKHIPYRNSKLTRLIKDALGGNSKTVMIANVSPSSASYEESYNTLNYATRAKKINSKLRNNIVSVDMHVSKYIKLVEELRFQNTKLKQQLEEALKERDAARNLQCSTRSVPLTPLPKTVQPEEVRIQSVPVTSLPKTVQQEQVHIQCVPVTSPKTAPQDEVNPEQQKKWKSLHTLFELQASFSRDVLKFDSEIKTLKLRIQRKEIITKRLNAFGCDKEGVFSDKPVQKFHARISSLQNNLKSTKRQQRNNQNLIDVILEELRRGNLKGQVEEMLVEKEYKLKIQERSMHVEHLRRFLDMYISEVMDADNIIEIILPKWVQYYSMLNGYNKTTDAMRAEYEKIRHLLRGVKAVTWEDTPGEEGKLRKLTKLSPIDISSMPGDLVHCNLMKNDIEENEVLVLPTVPSENKTSLIISSHPEHDDVALHADSKFQHIEDSILLSSQLFECNITEKPSIKRDYKDSIVSVPDVIVPVVSYDDNVDKGPTFPSDNMDLNKTYTSSSENAVNDRNCLLNSTFSLKGCNGVKFNLPVVDNKPVPVKVLAERNASRFRSPNLFVKDVSKAVPDSFLDVKNKSGKSPMSREQGDGYNKENRCSGRPATQSQLTLIKPSPRFSHLSTAPRPQTSLIPGSMKFQRGKGPRFSTIHPYQRPSTSQGSETSYPRRPR